MQIDPERMKRWAVEALKARGQKSELSPQAVAVIEAVAAELSEVLNTQLKPRKPSESAKRQLTDEWCAAYEFVKGRKYVFDGAKDGKAADKLLATGLPVGEIVALAAKAWKTDAFNCRQAATLAGFACRYNYIRDEVENPQPERRRFERQGNTRAVAGEVL